MHLLIIGGHLTPAIAFMQYGSTQKTTFTYIVDARSTPHLAREAQLAGSYASVSRIKTMKFHRHQRLRAFLSLPLLLKAIFTAHHIIQKSRPIAIISFGGYLAIPIAIAGFFHRVPFYLHEQTSRAGLANRLLAPLARRIFLSYQSSLAFFPPQKSEVVGNFIREEFLSPQPRPSWLRKSSKPLLLITGASQGSKIINQTIHSLIEPLTKTYQVVHQFGQSPIKLPSFKGYYPRDWLSASEFAYCLSHAELAIARSGANTVTELLYTGTPAVLIPLKFAQQNEQLHNAKLLQNQRLAILLKEEDLTSESLLTAIQKAAELKRQPQTYRSPAPLIYQHLLNLIPS